MKMNLILNWNSDERINFWLWQKGINISKCRKYKNIECAVRTVKKLTKQLNIQVGTIEYLASTDKRYKLYIKGLNK